MKKKIRLKLPLILLLFLISTVSIACKSKKDITKPKTTNTTQKSAHIKGNGTLFVTYNDSTYYREYTAKSFEKTGLFAHYAPVANTMKQMVCLSSDGTKKAVFKDNGDGPIYLINNRFYLQRVTDSGYSTYSIDLDGKNRKNIASSSIMGFDEDSSTLILGHYSEEGNGYHIDTYNCNTQALTEIKFKDECSKILAVDHGTIYYTVYVPYGSEKGNQLRINCINIDGKKEKRLVTTPQAYEKELNYFCEVSDFHIVGNQIFCVYGAYAGTGNFFQGGELVMLNKDGSDIKYPIPPQDPENDGNKDSYANSDLNETIYVSYDSQNKATAIYYSYLFNELSSDVYRYDLSSKKITKVKRGFEIHENEIPFIYHSDDDTSSICVYESGQHKLRQLVKNIDFSDFDEFKNDPYIKNDYMSYDNNYVYYIISANQYTESESIGWRDGYTRLSTKTYRTNIKTQKTELLYEY